jgi:hypothetical protein
MFRLRLFACLALLLLATGSARAQCIGGATDGSWNLPVGNVAGSAEGDVRIGQTGPSLFKLHATLIGQLHPATPFQGVVDGFLDPLTATQPGYQVRGRWFADPVTGEGYFRCVLITLGAHPEVVGRIGGKFSDPPSYTEIGQYTGSWSVCP